MLCSEASTPKRMEEGGGGGKERGEGERREGEGEGRGGEREKREEMGGDGRERNLLNCEFLDV